jgi:DcuC family C4-dicarboxylate transporter
LDSRPDGGTKGKDLGTTLQLLGILGVFGLAVALMYQKRLNTLIGLPLLAVSMGVIVGLSPGRILTEIVTEGAVRLHNPIIVILFGAALAEVVKRTGLVESLIKNTAEFLGDRKLLITLALTLILSLLFTVLAGLGAIVMVGSIVFPILISIGLPNLVAGCIFLFALSIGGMLNLFNWSLYTEVLKLSTTQIREYALYYLPITIAVTVVFIVLELRRSGGSSFKLAVPSPKDESGLSLFAYFTPLVPVFLIFLNPFSKLVLFPAFEQLGSPIGGAWAAILKYEFPITGALLVALIYGVLTAPKKLGSRSQLLTRCMIDGIQSVAPAIALMLGIGMLLKGVGHPDVKALLAPVAQGILPTTGMGYLAFFTLAAPLALYRGPLNIWGMGSGLVAIIQESQTIPTPAIMAALIAVGQIQGISDPTNTYSVWIANYLGVDVVKILKKTIFWSWLMAALGLILAVGMYY